MSSSKIDRSKHLYDFTLASIISEVILGLYLSILGENIFRSFERIESNQPYFFYHYHYTLSIINKIIKETCFMPVLETDLHPTLDQEVNEVHGAKEVNKVKVVEVPILQGSNSNEGFLKMMKFLTREFPTDKLHSEGFTQV